MNQKIPARPKPDEEWADIIASYSAGELVAGKLIAPEQRDFARRIIAQQIYILLASNCYPAGDLNSN